MFSAVLVANRGEIAVRVVTTCRRLGVRAIAVYSDADARAPHVRLADDAVRIGPPPAAESYLSIERIVDAARSSGAEAVHPGYGFLSENPAFARACGDAGLTFIGPPPEAMEALGDKVKAKAAAHAANVPVLPGLEHPGLTDDEIVEFVEGGDVLPLMVKAAAGGGGRGMRVVHERAELRDALEAARREAKAGFGDDTLLVESYVPESRHVEFQVFADSHGNCVHLGERECSLQRRHQKVVEESPSPVITPAVRDRLGSGAVELFKQAGYVGAGTAEFLVPVDAVDEAYFLEVNARLQVEHPVTELVTGLDLVELQLRIAAGEELGLTQDDISLTGHAVELRVCAEDPASGFLPATGTVLDYRVPTRPGVRLDSGIERGSVVGSNYDSLLAKLIAFGPDRETAFDTCSRALRDLRILGVTTNAGFLARLIDSPAVRAGEMSTSLIEQGVAATDADDATRQRHAVAVALDEALKLTEHPGDADPWDSLVGWRLDGPAPLDFELRAVAADTAFELSVQGPPHATEVRLGDERFAARAARAGDGRVAVTVDERREVYDHAAAEGEHWIASGADAFAFTLVEPVVEAAAVAAEGALEAPMPGTVLSVRAGEGDAVEEGQVLVVIESMKMELSLTAPRAATVAAVHVKEGQSVNQGEAVVELEAGE